MLDEQVIWIDDNAWFAEMLASSLKIKQFQKHHPESLFYEDEFILPDIGGGGRRINHG